MSSAPPPQYNDRPNYQQGPPPMAQPMYMGPPMAFVGDYPTQCTCPQCGKQVVSRIEKKIGLFTWLICAVLFFFFFWPCSCIPFCVDACKDTQHYCPNCGALLGVSKKL